MARKPATNLETGMPKLLAIASTLTTLAVLATSGAAFAGKFVYDHRHAPTPPAANSPPPAAARTSCGAYCFNTRPYTRSKVVANRAFKRAGPLKDSGPGNSVPSGGKTTEIK